MKLSRNSLGQLRALLQVIPFQHYPGGSPHVRLAAMHALPDFDERISRSRCIARKGILCASQSAFTADAGPAVRGDFFRTRPPR